jgi:hypothetical protein
VGGRNYASGDINHTFARYSRDGKLDRSFADGGIKTVAVAKGENRDGPWAESPSRRADGS